MSELRERRLERAAMAGDRDSLRELIATLARRGMFFVCEECGACVPPNARDRHDYEHEYHRQLEAEADRIHAQSKAGWGAYELSMKEFREREEPPREKGAMRLVQLPPVRPHPGGRPRNEPLYHRILLPPGLTQTLFFSGQTGHSNPRGQRGSLPAGHHFYAYGLSLIADEGADPDALRQIRNEAHVMFLLGGASSMPAHFIAGELPGHVTVNTRHFLASEVLGDPDGLSGLVPMHRMSIRGRPIELAELQAFGVDLVMSGQGLCASVGMTCVVHGLRLVPLTG